MSNPLTIYRDGDGSVRVLGYDSLEHYMDEEGLVAEEFHTFKRPAQRGAVHPSTGEAGAAAVDPVDGPPVPAWAVERMRHHEWWASHWSTTAHELAYLLRAHADDAYVARALRAYDELNGRWNRPTVTVAHSSEEGS